jgi:hypothetical protein
VAKFIIISQLGHLYGWRFVFVCVLSTDDAGIQMFLTILKRM